MKRHKNPFCGSKVITRKHMSCIFFNCFANEPHLNEKNLLYIDELSLY